jgi:nitroimidazol reductase NimA-like FMN-containing flavoprotein (pyridoxamine 5'-phosphate oxidase superfamily)/RimJ/RimL family protein N-acetyltransferase
MTHPANYPITDRTTATRLRERMSYDRQLAHEILDEAWHCTLSFIVDGEPRALPTLFVRIGETVYVHASTGSRPILAARDGLRVCFTVTLLDALILARSQFHHSANYRSLVAHGTATPVRDEAERSRVFTALVEKVGPGRSEHTRPPTAKELAQTTVLALPLTEVSVKARAHGVVDDEEDLDLPYWAGVVPLRTTRGLPVNAPGVTAAPPSYLSRSPWHEPVTLRGKHVVLEPLAMSHVDGLFEVIGGDEEVWRYLNIPRADTREQMELVVSKALEWQAAGLRVPFAQLDVQTGEVLGTTSYFPEPALECMEIGATYLARKAWRTAINTEAKLLLMERAFEVLAAVRVSWQTDVRNERSQRAIERLGAVREGVLRANGRRADGTPRDSVIYSMVASEWPNARSALLAKLDRD